MEALDLSYWIAKEESPELTAFKKKVLALAKRHSSQFHCGSVRDELRELGIHDLDSVETKVPVHLVVPPFAFDIEIPLKDLKDKDGDAQLAVAVDVLVKGQRDAIARQGGFGVLTSFSLDASSVTEISVRTPSEPQPGTPVRGVWMYASDDGRVRHFFQEEPTGRVDRDTWRLYVPAGTPDAADTVMTTRRRPLCGITIWSTPVNRSSRAQGRNCEGCNRRYNALTAPAGGDAA